MSPAGRGRGSPRHRKAFETRAQGPSGRAWCRSEPLFVARTHHARMRNQPDLPVRKARPSTDRSESLHVVVTSPFKNVRPRPNNRAHARGEIEEPAPSAAPPTPRTPRARPVVIRRVGAGRPSSRIRAPEREVRSPSAKRPPAIHPLLSPLRHFAPAPSPVSSTGATVRRSFTLSMNVRGY